MSEEKIEDQGLPLPPVDLLDYVLFVPFMLAFALTLLVFDPLQRIAYLFGQAEQQRVVRWLNWCLQGSIKLAGVRIRVDGEIPEPDGRALIVISNHQSLFDIPILHCTFHRFWPRFVAKRELARGIPSVSYNLRKGGSGLIDRNNPRQALPELAAFAERAVAQGFAAVIFPEGTRARGGMLKHFKPAGITTLFQKAEGARIVAVVLENSWILSARKFGPVPRGTVVKVRVLGELDRNGLKPKELMERAEGVIREGLQGLRAEASTN